jgi:hypothetical protein
MTGYSDVGAIDSAVIDAVLLKKPYRLGDLAGSIEKAIRQREGNAGAGNVVTLHRA